MPDFPDSHKGSETEAVFLLRSCMKCHLHVGLLPMRARPSSVNLAELLTDIMISLFSKRRCPHNVAIVFSRVLSDIETSLLYEQSPLQHWQTQI